METTFNLNPFVSLLVITAVVRHGCANAMVSLRNLWLPLGARITGRRHGALSSPCWKWVEGLVLEVPVPCVTVDSTLSQLGNRCTITSGNATVSSVSVVTAKGRLNRQCYLHYFETWIRCKPSCVSKTYRAAQTLRVVALFCHFVLQLVLCVTHIMFTFWCSA